MERPSSSASQGNDANTMASSADGQRESDKPVAEVVQYYQQENTRLEHEVHRLRRQLRGESPFAGLSKTARLKLQYARPEKPVYAEPLFKPQGDQKKDDSPQISSVSFSPITTIFSTLPTQAPVYQDRPAQTDPLTIPAGADVEVMDAHVQTELAVDLYKPTLTVTAARQVASWEPEEAPGDDADLSGSGQEVTLIEHVEPSGHGQEVQLIEEASPSGFGQEEMPVDAGEELPAVQSFDQTEYTGHLGPVIIYDSSVLEGQRRIARLFNRRVRKVNRAARKMVRKKKSSSTIIDFIIVPPQLTQPPPLQLAAAGEDFGIEDGTVYDTSMAEPQADYSAPEPVFDAPAEAVSLECDMEEAKEEEEEEGEAMTDPIHMEILTREPSLPAPVPQMAPQETLPDRGSSFPVPATPAGPASTTTSPAATHNPLPAATNETRVADSLMPAFESESAPAGEKPPGSTVIPGIGPVRPLEDSRTEKSSQLGSSKEGKKPERCPITPEIATVEAPTAAIPSEQAPITSGPGSTSQAASPSTTSAAAPALIPWPRARGVRPLKKSRLTGEQKAKIEEERRAIEAAGLQRLEPPPKVTIEDLPEIRDGEIVGPQPWLRPELRPIMPLKQRRLHGGQRKALAEEQSQAEGHTSHFCTGPESTPAEPNEKTSLGEDSAENAVQEEGEPSLPAQEVEDEPASEEHPDPGTRLTWVQLMKHLKDLCTDFLAFCDGDSTIELGVKDRKDVHDYVEWAWTEFSGFVDDRFEHDHPTWEDLGTGVNKEFGATMIDHIIANISSARHDEKDKYVDIWHRVVDA